MQTDSKNMNDNCIDFVIAWVDGTDEKWQKRKADATGVSKDSSKHYRDWGFLPYLFKSIELYAPWVHHIYLVTDGQIPKCVDELPDSILKKLTIVDHRDFIPDKYLPTFNSHTIELNFHRIEGLSEQFVYFNDDVLLTAPCKPTTFFKNGKAVDEAVLNGINGEDSVFAGIQFHNMALMNKHYDISAVRKNISKWLNFQYGMQNIRTLLLLPFRRLQAIHNPHGPMPLLKSTFEILWDRDFEMLDRTCQCKLRDEGNVSIYVVRYEQLLSANFEPKKNENAFLQVTDGETKLARALEKSQSVCINDVELEEKEYVIIRSRIQALLDKKYKTNKGQ